VAELFVVNGICGGTVFFLPDVPTVLGRSPECHIQVADPWISSMHALFERRGDQLWVVDLDSRNGTFVEEERVHEAPVAPGMKLRFGKTHGELRSHPEALEPPGVLADQRTIIRYIADIASDASGDAWQQTPEAHPTGGSRPETLRGGPTGVVGPARRQIGVVNEISRSLLGAEGLQDALARVLRVLAGAVAAERASVLLMDERGEMVPVVAEPSDDPPHLSATVIQTTLRSRAGILTLDAQQDLRFARSQSVIAQGIRSCICAPIWADNRILGIILLERGVTDPFTADDLDLATLVGFHAALAVERTRSAERLQATEDVRERLLRHLDPAATERLLAAEPPASADAPDAPELLEPAAREDAAVMVAALVGLGELLAARPAREVAERALALQRALAGIARAEGAAVEEQLDGGLVVVFGLAEPRPDAAAVALRCARAMLERTIALEAVFDAPRLQLRMGIESGLVVAGNFGLPNRPELRAVGDAAAVALRLAAEAAPGEALAGPGASGRSRRAGDEVLEPREGGGGALRIA
jgi:adenylate cyclase